jgi:hypothetical protein
VEGEAVTVLTPVTVEVTVETVVSIRLTTGVTGFWDGGLGVGCAAGGVPVPVPLLLVVGAPPAPVIAATWVAALPTEPAADPTDPVGGAVAVPLPVAARNPPVAPPRLRWPLDGEAERAEVIPPGRDGARRTPLSPTATTRATAAAALMTPYVLVLTRRPCVVVA